MKLYRVILFCGIAAILLFAPLARGAVRVWSMTPILIVEYALIFLWLLKQQLQPLRPTRADPDCHSRESGNPDSSPRKRGLKHSGMTYSNRAFRIGWILASFAALAAISAIFSVYKYASFSALGLLFGQISVFYMIAIEFDGRLAHRLLRFVIITASMISIFGIFQYIGVFTSSWWMPREFLAATFTNHNHFAGYLELVMPVAIAIFISSGTRQRRRFWIGVSLIVLITAFLLTESRGGWAALSTALLVMAAIFFKGRDAKKRGAVSIIFLLILVAFSLAYIGRDIVAERAQTMTTDESFKTRFKIWQGAIKMIQNRPFMGTGIGTFERAFPRFRPEGLVHIKANSAHNDYLESACDMGIFAPLIMIIFIGAIVKRGFSFNAKDPYIFGCAVGVLSLSLHGLIDFNFHIPSNMILFIVYCAIINNRAGRC